MGVGVGGGGWLDLLKIRLTQSQPEAGAGLSLAKNVSFVTVEDNNIRERSSITSASFPPCVSIVSTHTLIY